MSGIPYLPIETSRLGPVDVAFEDNNGVIPFGLGPCSQALTVAGRHGSQCWGEFPSQWLNQKDSSASCMWEHKLQNISAHYTTPRTNQVSQLSGLTPMQMGNVEKNSAHQPPCVVDYTGFTTARCPNNKY